MRSLGSGPGTASLFPTLWSMQTEIDGPISVCIDLIDHVLELRLCWVLAQGPHHCAQLFGRDGAIAILVEEGEGLLELSNLFFGQLVGHGRSSVRKCNRAQSQARVK